MGYHMYLEESTAKFKIKNTDKILKVIQELAGKAEEKGGTSSRTYQGVTTIGYAWVDDNFHKIDNIENMFEAWGWGIDKYKKFYHITEFFGEKSGNDDILFKTIAPYMEDGFVHMRGEDSHHWKWKFKKGKFREVEARLVFEDEFHIDLDE